MALAVAGGGALAVGARVLAGVADPGCVVLHPLVAYNVLAGLLGVIAAWQRALDAPVATESLTAMAFRTALWAIVLIAARRSLSERLGSAVEPKTFIERVNWT